LDWMSPYNVGDTIRFETSKGVDMLYISEREIIDKKDPFIEHEGIDPFSDYHASAHYVGKFIHNFNSHYFSMSIYKGPNEQIAFWIVFAERYCFGISDARNMNEQGTSIKDTLIIDSANSEYNISGPVSDNCEHIKWSKKEGLIEYRLRDGTVYPKP